MAYDDLRDWIKALDKAKELTRIREEIDPILEIAEIPTALPSPSQKMESKAAQPSSLKT